MEILIIYLYEAAGQSNDILSEDEYHENDKHPKNLSSSSVATMSICVQLDYFGIHLVSVNDAILIYYLFFRLE